MDHARYRNIGEIENRSRVSDVTMIESMSEHALARQRAQARLPPEVNRILYVKNLPFNLSADEMYDIFGKYGAIRQIRRGNSQTTRGKAFVVYEDIYDAKTAADHLSGFNVGGRYLIVLYHQVEKAAKKIDTETRKKDLEQLKKKHKIENVEDI